MLEDNGITAASGEKRPNILFPAVRRVNSGAPDEFCQRGCAGKIDVRRRKNRPIALSGADGSRQLNGNLFSPETVRSVVLDEERRFVDLLERGRRVLTRLSGHDLSEGDYRFLHETHGLPREIVDLLRRQEEVRAMS